MNNDNEDIDDPRTMEVTYGTAMHESRAARKRSREMARFLHHYQRWNAHKESAALEKRMADNVCTRLAPVVEAAIAYNGNEYIFSGNGISFVHAAFTELLECRSMLQHSYAFGYFRYQSADKRKYKLLKKKATEKIAFEQFQSELELMTEQISDVVARSRLRATQMQISYLTAATSEKRKEFSNIMVNILLDEKKESDDKEAKQKKGKRGDDQSASESKKTKHSGGMLESITGIISTDNSAPSYTDSDESDVNGDAIRRSLERFLHHSTDDDFLEYEEHVSDWACPACTYMNAGGRSCAMCGTARP